MNPEELLRRAAQAMQRSYSPYSHCRVGAALLTKSGRVYEGCNIENAAFSPTCCAERVALFQAVAQGEREFAAIAVVGGKDGVVTDLFPPCGVCRQVMQEFCTSDFPIYLGAPGTGVVSMTLGDLLPCSFGSSAVLGEEAGTGDNGR